MAQATTAMDRGSRAAPGAALLEVSDLTVAFPARNGMVVAANGVSLSVAASRTLGLVGESGCGKSVTLRAILDLVPDPGEIIGGRISWSGRDLIADRAGWRDLRGTAISMIFQDPSSSLNPVLSIGDQLTETLRLRVGLGRREAAERARELLDRVGIPSPSARMHEYPHQLSGGMRQRVMIAIAIATGPRLLLADEPTTALDVTIQDQILWLLAEIKEQSGMAMILVSHDVGVIARNADDIAVMYAGHIVEQGTARDVITAPRHPYTRGLLEAIPRMQPRASRGRLVPILGQPPDLSALPEGCPFAPRCPHRRDGCASVTMRLDVTPPGHGSACPFVGAVA
jgi:oligopeptide/dipeptide ABC transporter ATP-binding protein